MPSPSAAMPLSPRNASGGGTGTAGAMRPPLMKRQSSQSSTITSPGASVGEHQPLRHHVKPRHTKIVLPRNHNSARNLTKLNRQPQNDDGRKHSRQRSHEGDTEIRLPGSLDDNSARPTIKRNLTAYQLPRAGSNVKLKKNLSHGQLTRLGSGRNLAALNSTAHRAPPSPGLKGKNKRPKSAELTGAEKEVLEQNVTRQQTRTVTDKKVGFAVGSSGDTSGDEIAPEMEGSGLQEDEWTEESASASPYSTRQNTANNSRRTSMNVKEASERQTPGQLLGMKLSEQVHTQTAAQKQNAVEAEVESESDEDEPPSPRTMARVRRSEASSQASQPAAPQSPISKAPTQPQQPQPSRQPLSPLASHPPTDQTSQRPSQPPQVEPRVEPDFQHNSNYTQPKAPPPRSPLHQAKDYKVDESHAKETQVEDYANPATRRLLSKSQPLPGPAMVSSVSAQGDMGSPRGSPAPSLRSSKSNMGDGAGDGEQDELVSRFVPSASHPNSGSGANTAASTPKQGSFHTPEQGTSFLAQQRRSERGGFQIGPTSPGSVRSGSSGATTPATGRSRTELRLLQEKALADMESRVDLKPHLPAWQYDRRNESLKSYFNASNMQSNGMNMGPEIFQGRFRAVNTELRVVQKFRDPIGEAVARLKNCKGSKLNQQEKPASSLQKQPTTTPGMTTSKSAVALSATQKAKNFSKSASPPNQSSPLKRGAQSTVQFAGGAERQKQKREVSFVNAPPETREFVPDKQVNATAVAEALWNGRQIPN